LAKLREALKQISRGEGRFSRDQLEHASNTIGDMKELARIALAAEPSVDKRTGWLIVSQDEAKLRFLLWAMHPCIGKYGDDGELQCTCGCDFRRDSVEEIERKTWEMNMRKLAASPEEKP
jgi:hypothetical protein